MSFIVIALIFILFAASRAIARYRDGSLTKTGLIIWLLIWCAAGLVVWMPDITMKVASALGIGRGADLAVYGAVIVLYYLVFRMYIFQNKAQQDITRLVRTLAIKEAKKK